MTTLPNGDQPVAGPNDIQKQRLCDEWAFQRNLLRLDYAEKEETPSDQPRGGSTWVPRKESHAGFRLAPAHSPQGIRRKVGFFEIKIETIDRPFIVQPEGEITPIL